MTTLSIGLRTKMGLDVGLAELAHRNSIMDAKKKKKQYCEWEGETAVVTIQHRQLNRKLSVGLFTSKG